MARSAGAALAARVTAIPTVRLMAAVRQVTTVAAAGSWMPEAPSRALRPLAKPIPAPRPSTEDIVPMIVPSARIDARTWRRDAPKVRRVASSRVRWATVIESVLKMMNEPTSRATAPKASST